MEVTLNMYLRNIANSKQNLLNLSNNPKDITCRQTLGAVMAKSYFFLCGYLQMNLSVSPEILRYGRKAKETKRGSRISWVAY